MPSFLEFIKQIRIQEDAMQTRCFNKVSDVASAAATLSPVRRADRRSGENNLLNTMCWASAARHAALSSQTEQRAGLICCAVIPGGVSALSHRSSLASRTRSQQTLSPATQYNSCFSDLKQNINTYVSQSLLAIFLKLSLLLLCEPKLVGIVVACAD